MEKINEFIQAQIHKHEMELHQRLEHFKGKIAANDIEDWYNYGSEDLESCWESYIEVRAEFPAPGFVYRDDWAIYEDYYEFVHEVLEMTEEQFDEWRRIREGIPSDEDVAM